MLRIVVTRGPHAGAGSVRTILVPDARKEHRRLRQRYSQSYCGITGRKALSRKHLVVLALSAALAPPAANACQSAGPATAIDAVRAQRVAFNEAIARKDIEAVAAALHDNIILVTGTASEVFTGRAAQVSLWQKDFADPGRAVYVRTTDCVRVSEVFPVALETGRWRGVREGQADSSADRSFAAGVYAAKWRRVDGTWLLESEIFATESCGGAFCPVEDADTP
jgi:ketosteroid isomerase-like protein